MKNKRKSARTQNTNESKNNATNALMKHLVHQHNEFKTRFDAVCLKICLKYFRCFKKFGPKMSDDLCARPSAIITASLHNAISAKGKF